MDKAPWAHKELHVQGHGGASEVLLALCTLWPPSLTPVLIISHPKTEWWWLMSLWIRNLGVIKLRVLLLVQAGSLSMCLRFGWLMMAGMSGTTGPSLSAVCHPLACSHGRLKFPKKIKTELLKPLHVSNFAIVPTVKANHQVHDERVEKRLHLLPWEERQSHFAKVHASGKGQFCCHFPFTKKSYVQRKGTWFLSYSPRELWKSFKP